ncbi:MAG: cupin domain-containing protein [Anaerolineae bacterium]|jgi:quercetin dioxygenase-like cupin family protein|nr:cupin domain-containing protein [Anaerolineae bacterium]
MLRDSGKHPSRYHIFVLSLWKEGADYPGDNMKWRFGLENARRTERKGFKNLEDLTAYLKIFTQDAPGETTGDPPSTAKGEYTVPMSINRASTTPIVHAPNAGETLTALGVTITYKSVGAQTNGQWLVLEYTAPPQFAGPPPHWHKVTTEIFYVLEGVLTLRVGDETIQAGPGSYAYVPPGTVHAFSNQTDAPARYLLVASPAGLESYFAELAELVKTEPSWPPKDMGKVIALMAKYDTFPPQANA